MKNFIIRYGLYSACILIVLGLINWFLVAPNGITLSETFGYASIIAALMAIPMAIKYFRDKLNNGQVTFSGALKIGLGVSLITSIVKGLYSMVFFYLQGDEFMQWYEENMSPEEWQTTQEQMQQMGDLVYAPWFQGVIMFVTVFIIGFIIALVSSLILKK